MNLYKMLPPIGPRFLGVGCGGGRTFAFFGRNEQGVPTFAIASSNEARIRRIYTKFLTKTSKFFARAFRAHDHSFTITVENGCGVLKLVTNAISTDAIST